MCLPTLSIDTLLLKDIIAPAASTLTALVLASTGYWLALRQLRHKTRLDVREDLRKRKADALQTAWSLLQALTTADNSDNLMRYTQSIGPDRNRQYFMHLPNAQAFVFKRLPTAFYANGAGLHWSKEIKDLFFEARGIIYGYLHARQAAHAPEAIDSPNPDATELWSSIDNPELPKRLENIYQALNEILRKELQAVYAPDF